MSAKNTKPSTPFGKFFFKIGVWHPNAENTIAAMYEKLHTIEQEAIEKASSIIAIASQNVDQAPDFIFELIQKKWPDVTKDNAVVFLNNIATKMAYASEHTPTTFDAALAELQTYLGKFKDDGWIASVRAVVSVGAVFLTSLHGNTAPIQTIETVLEYVYQNFVKGKV